MSKVLENLNCQQEEAVLYEGGPLLVLAGAGSGKTRVITRRIAYLIKSRGINPYKILAVTFTNKAAKEMKGRIQEQLGLVKLPWMGTFHSIAAKILRIELPSLNRDSNFTIIDSSDQISIVRDVIRNLKFDEKKLSPYYVKNKISIAKNSLLKSSDFASQAYGPKAKRIAQVYEEYQRVLKENNCLDFDDLILDCVNILRENKKIKNKYQEQFQHILIDEYQDVNHSQYSLAKLLCGEKGNICVVGDDDQSIYGFRGADVSIILRFEQDYPGAKVIKLEENYRSTKTILEAAHSVVSHNKGRKEKKLWTEGDKGEKLTGSHCTDGREEARFVVRQIKKWHKEGTKFKDFVVLYRTNSQSRSIEEILKQEGIDYNLIGGLRFYDRAEIKDAISYVKFIVNPKDYLSFKRIINLPSRGIGNVTRDKIIKEASIKNESLIEIMKHASQLPRVGKKIQNTLSEFADSITKLREEKDKMQISDFINKILNDIGYFEMLKNDSDPRKFEKIDNLQELISDAKEFEISSSDKSLEAFLEKIALYTDIDSKKNGNDKNEGKVTLMTVHSAKGLEFPIVFIIGLEDGLFPHFRSIQEGTVSAIEEERRLFYVALTRAQKKVYLTYARERTIQGHTHNQSPSVFLREIPQDLFDRYLPELSERHFTRKVKSPLDRPLKREFLSKDKYKKDNQVYHKIFGKGIVKKSEKGYVTVLFNGKVTKVLSEKFLNPYGNVNNFKSGDKVTIKGKVKTDGIVQKTDGDFVYVILSEGKVEKYNKSKISTKE